MARSVRAVVLLPAMMAAALGGFSQGCDRVDGRVDTVQRAVGTGAQGALAARPAVTAPPSESLARGLEPSAQPPQGPSLADRVPVGHPEGVGATARMEFAADRDHQEIAATPMGEHVGVTWTDQGHGRVYFGQVSRAGQPEGAATVLHTLADAEEESIASPSVVAVPGGFGVAWVDHENGRVRFRRLDAAGAPQGRATIVHEGLEDPTRATLGWNGTEFAVAVQLRQGVYFARVSAAGERLGDGSILAEGERVEGVDALAWRNNAWTVGYTLTESGVARRRQERIAPDSALQGTRAEALPGALLAAR